MSTTMTAMPEVTTQATWREARLKLLAKEKELTGFRDAINAERRRLPMVAVEKEYEFEGPDGRKTLRDLFEGRRQLLIYHFMFDPDDPPEGKSGAPWTEGCPGCSCFVDNMPHLSHLNARNTTFVLVSRAPLSKIQPFKKRMGWTLPWYSSFGSQFNYDFGVTLDESLGFTEWNYQDTRDLVAQGKIPDASGELPGLSAFLQDGNDVYFTYATYARGLDQFLNTNNLLDMTAYGRQETWEDSPAGWPQTSPWWLKHHDRYDEQAVAKESCCHASEV